MIKSIWFRCLFAFLVPLIIICILFLIYKVGSPFPCIFYKVTGFYCPGCGDGRALYALLHFDIVSSLRNNLLFLPMSFIVTWYFVKIYLKIVLNKDILPFFNVSARFMIIFIFIIIFFWILRNIKMYPFTLLAPI